MKRVKIILLFLVLWSVFDYYSENLKQSTLDIAFEIMLKNIITKTHNYSFITTILFSLILILNFLGLVPYTQTVTAQLFFTLFLATSCVSIIWIHGFVDNKILIFNHFLPSGTPFLLNFFIILIEIISNLSRIISLSVRLYANITSGHILLKILANFSLVILIVAKVIKIISLVIFSVIFIITFLEILIAFLQAYVFVTLIAIYISELE